MENPEHFPTVLRVGMIVLTVLFVSFGLLSYLAYGDRTKDMITLNLPRSPLSITVQFSYCVALYLTYSIMMFPAVQILEETACLRRCCGVLCCRRGGRGAAAFVGGGGRGGGGGGGGGCEGEGEDEGYDNDGDGDGANAALPSLLPRPQSLLFRTILVLCSGVVAFSVPHFSLFLNLIGAVACSALAFILPVAFFHRLYGDDQKAWRKGAHVGVVVFGAIGSMTSLVVTVLELVRVSTTGEEV